MIVETMTDSTGHTYQFQTHAGPWRVGDHVAYTREYATCPNYLKSEQASRRRWRGVIVSCRDRGGFLVMDAFGFNLTTEGQVFAQYPHVLRKLGR